MRKNVYCSNRSQNDQLLVFYFVGVSANDVMDFLLHAERMDPQKLILFQDIPVDEEGNFPFVLGNISPSPKFAKKRFVDLVSAQDIIIIPKDNNNSWISQKVGQLVFYPQDQNSYEMLFLTHDIDWMTEVYCRDRGFVERFIGYVCSKAKFEFSDDKSLFV